MKAKESDVLDTYIIDRIRRERRREQDTGQQPLRIERRPPPAPRPPPRDERRDDRPDRGSTIIDYSV